MLFDTPAATNKMDIAFITNQPSSPNLKVFIRQAIEYVRETSTAGSFEYTSDSSSQESDSLALLAKAYALTPPTTPFSSSAHSVGPRRQHKKHATKYQVAYLEYVFGEKRYPSTFEKNKIATALGMRPKSVCIWFQNKRQATK